LISDWARGVPQFLAEGWSGTPDPPLFESPTTLTYKQYLAQTILVLQKAVGVPPPKKFSAKFLSHYRKERWKMNLKNFDFLNVTLIKLSVCLATLFWVSVWTGFADWVMNTHWGWFAVSSLIVAIRPVRTALRK